MTFCFCFGLSCAELENVHKQWNFETQHTESKIENDNKSPTTNKQQQKLEFTTDSSSKSNSKCNLSPGVNEVNNEMFNMNTHTANRNGKKQIMNDCNRLESIFSNNKFDVKQMFKSPTKQKSQSNPKSKKFNFNSEKNKNGNSNTNNSNKRRRRRGRRSKAKNESNINSEKTAKTINSNEIKMLEKDKKLANLDKKGKIKDEKSMIEKNTNTLRLLKKSKKRQKKKTNAKETIVVSSPRRMIKIGMSEKKGLPIGKFSRAKLRLKMIKKLQMKSKTNGKS